MSYFSPDNQKPTRTVNAGFFSLRGLNNKSAVVCADVYLHERPLIRGSFGSRTAARRGNADPPPPAERERGRAKLLGISTPARTQFTIQRRRTSKAYLSPSPLPRPSSDLAAWVSNGRKLPPPPRNHFDDSSSTRGVFKVKKGASHIIKPKIPLN